MARQSMYTQPWRKHMEAYFDFSGGLNTVVSNDNLRVNEMPYLQNADLGERGSIRPRRGHSIFFDPAVQAKGQGFFRYDDETFFYAKGGKLYNQDDEVQKIDGVDITFQAEKNIGAVRFESEMHFATGSGLYTFDGENFSKVEPYKPEPLEALYIGTNALASNPSDYIADGTGSTLQINGVRTSLRYGVVNTTTIFEAFITRPTGMVVEFEFRYRFKGDEDWITGKEFSESRTWNFKPERVGEFEIFISARDKANPTNIALYALPRYKVDETDQNIPLDTSLFDKINKCNRILVYWRRFIIYNDDPSDPNIYTSHLQKIDYFPIPNILELKDDFDRGCNLVIPYRDVLAVSTEDQWYAIFGKYPAEFQTVRLHSTIGCIAPDSADVMENDLVFVSKRGIHKLKAVSFTENRLNIEKIDQAIENEIQEQDATNAIGVVHENQYHIVFPETKTRYRYYFTQGKVWTRDHADFFDFNKMQVLGNDLYSQNALTGQVYKYNKDSLQDNEENYEGVIETKFFDFHVPYHTKKLKELQLLIGSERELARLKVYVYADSALVLTPEKTTISVGETGEVEVETETKPNLVTDAGTTFGEWELGTSSFGEVDSKVYHYKISGKCRRVKVRIEYDQGHDFRFLGLGIIFKLKKP